MASAPGAGAVTAGSPQSGSDSVKSFSPFMREGPSRARLLVHDGAAHLRLAGDLHDGRAGYAEHAGPRQRVHRHEQRAVDAAEGLARVVDARAVEIGLAVAVHVHAAADGPDE